MDRLLTEQELADLFAIEVQTLRVWRSKKKGPPYMKIVGTVRYNEKDVNTWLKQQEARHG